MVPFEAFHHHEDHDHHCDETNLVLESDPCHVSVVHGQFLEHSCDHESHLTESEESCELCKFVVTQRQQVEAFETTSSITIAFEKGINIPSQADESWNNVSGSILQRGPPNC